MLDTDTTPNDAPTDGDESGEPGDGPSRRQRGVLLAVIIAPFVAAVIRALRNEWFPIGDNALLFIRTRDVFTDQQPLLGSWTSASLSVGENMNNPGPMYDFLIAPFAHVFSPGPAAALGVATVNVACIVGISTASRYIGGWSMQRWFLLGSAALAWAMGSELLIDIWQANALLIPFLLMLVLLLGCASGLARCLPWTAAMATLLIQTHISYAYILAVLGVASVGLVWWQNRPVDWRALPARMRSRTTMVTGAVVVVLWSLPFVEQFFGDGRGNLTRLVSNSSGGDVTLGAANAVKITAAIFALPVWWMRSGFSTTVPITRLTETSSGPTVAINGLPGLALAVLAVVALLALLVGSTVVAARRDMKLHTCAGVIAVASVVGVIASLSILTVGTVGFSPHHVRWIWTQAVFVHVVLLWIAVDLWRARRSAVPTSDRDDRFASAGAIALAVALSLLNLSYEAHPEGPIARYDAMPAMRGVADVLDSGAADALAAADPVLYDTSNVRVFEPYSSTMMMFLQQRGVEFRVQDEGMVRQLGEGRRADGSETVTLFQLESEQALLYDGPACTIAVTSALSPDEEDQARADADVLADAIVTGALAIDTSEFTDADPLGVLDAAITGDRDAARTLVLDGTLSRWASNGWADPGDVDGDVDEAARRMQRIDDWWTTAFGLFATGLGDCPTAT